MSVLHLSFGTRNNQLLTLQLQVLTSVTASRSAASVTSLNNATSFEVNQSQNTTQIQHRKHPYLVCRLFPPWTQPLRERLVLIPCLSFKHDAMYVCYEPRHDYTVQSLLTPCLQRKLKQVHLPQDECCS